MLLDDCKEVQLCSTIKWNENVQVVRILMVGPRTGVLKVLVITHWWVPNGALMAYEKVLKIYTNKSAMRNFDNITISFSN